MGAVAATGAALTSWAAPHRSPCPCAAGAAHPTRRRVPPGHRAPCRRVRASLARPVRDGPGFPEEQDWAAVPRVTPAAPIRRGQPPPATRSTGASALRRTARGRDPLSSPCGPPGPLDAGRLSGLHHRGRSVTSGVTGSHCPAVRRFSDTQPQCSGLEMMAAPQGQKRQAVRACCKTRTKGAANPWGGASRPPSRSPSTVLPELRGRGCSGLTHRPGLLARLPGPRDALS